MFGVIWMGPKAVTHILTRKRQREFRDRPTEKGRRQRDLEAEIRVIWLQHEDAWSHQKLKEADNLFSPRAFRGIAALPTPQVWIHVL